MVDYSYDPYGNTKADAVINNSFQYTGRENDGTELYYYRARYYSPATHRFISEDPIGLAGGLNGYTYVEGDPVSFSDPTGLAPNGVPSILAQKYSWATQQEFFVNALCDFGRKYAAASETILTLLLFAPESAAARQLTAQELKSIRSYMKQIKIHEGKIEKFINNRTVRPGMEHMSKEAIAKQQQTRIDGLKTEIQTFKNNIQKIFNGEL